MKRSARTWEEVDALVDEEMREYIKWKSYDAAAKLMKILKEVGSGSDMHAMAGAFAGAIYIGLDMGIPNE